MDTKKLLTGLQDFRKALEKREDIDLDKVLETIYKFDEVIAGIDYRNCHEYCRIRYELYECKLYLQNKFNKQILNYVNPYDKNLVIIRKFALVTFRALYNKLPESYNSLVRKLEIYTEIVYNNEDDDTENFYEGLKLCAEVEGKIYGDI